MQNPGSTVEPTSQIITEGDPADRKPALFNLGQDPSEQRDVSKQNPEVVKRLKRLFKEWRQGLRAERRK